MNALSSRQYALIIDWKVMGRFLRFAVLFSSLGMTFLTYAKETALFGRAMGSWETVAYLISSKYYYPVWFCQVLALTVLAAWTWNQGRKSILLNLAFAIVSFNLVLVSANNVINIVQGRPLHSTHHGIGW